jgi:hypothetical protein
MKNWKRRYKKRLSPDMSYWSQYLLERLGKTMQNLRNGRSLFKSFQIQSKSLPINWLSRSLYQSCRSLSRRNVARGAPLGGGSTLHPWRQETAITQDWPRRTAFAEFRLCVGHDCLGTHLHLIVIRSDPFCMLCSLREPMDRNHLGHCRIN